MQLLSVIVCLTGGGHQYLTCFAALLLCSGAECKKLDLAELQDVIIER